MSVIARISNLLHLHSPGSARQTTNELVEISPDSDASYAAPDAILCVDVHKNPSALGRAVEYARKLYRPKRGTRVTSLPKLFALIDFRKLSSDQLWQVNNELIPAGALIFPYPNDCKSFEDAMIALDTEIEKTRKNYLRARRHLRSRPSVAAAEQLAAKTQVHKTAQATAAVDK
jgi:hypothetical protein